MASSPIWAMAWRRACRSPRLPSVMSFSTIGRSSLALGRVVTICSCLISDADMFLNIALRCEEVRFSLRPALLWRMVLSWYLFARGRSVVIFVTLGEVFDVFGRPVVDVHPEMEPHLGQHFLDLVERLAP